MAHSFDIPFEGPSDKILEKAKKAIEAGNGTMSGDPLKGSFSLPAGISKVKGEYLVDNSTLKVTITDKPIYVSGDMIENILKKHLA
ncbi:hypothetical protein P1X15_15010 [Runella sp. MFBS21]|uniref:hypothetical protein n=1 Tax=Runella sp. MFBS21 TaxID=3034018 RepID=UPI0023F8943B|nr:hypothetical protein [Runella sp. MFBS21]MDF7818924.1 hypothetical protein [Runella sp. MFBS21]